MKQSVDYLIVGGGIVGLAVARELRMQFPAAKIALLEKEVALARHASGRNSGVLHSGIYYDSDTLKAKVCAEGARRMKAFASEYGIGCRHSGKVIVATSEQDLPVIDRLLKNAERNRIRAECLDENEIRRIEPHAGVYRKGIYCPDTAVIDSFGVIAKLQELLTSGGVKIYYESPLIFVDADRRKVITPMAEFSYGYLFNCAGAWADKVARHFRLGLKYTLIPFKGIYLKLHPARAPLVRSNIYPVPDSDQPFLGTHLTRVFSGEVYAGPTAIPALGRENYGYIQGAKISECLRVLFELSRMYAANNQNFRRLVHAEFAKYRKRNFFWEVKKLLPQLTYEDLIPCNKVGIRPQLINVQEKRLEMDYVIEQTSDSLHVLNAISPAFTSSLAFAEWLVEQAGKANKSITS